MFNLLVRILLVVGGIVLLVALIGSLLPRAFETSAQVTIASPPEKIFPFVEDLGHWQSWSPWNAHAVSGLRVELGELTTGEGATQTWTEQRGEGKLWITRIDEPRLVRFSSLFAGFPQMDNEITLEGNGAETVVTWRATGSLPGGPFYGWFGLMFPAALGSEFSNALQRLKSTVEQYVPAD